jgi:hypothetical protein
MWPTLLALLLPIVLLGHYLLLIDGVQLELIGEENSVSDADESKAKGTHNFDGGRNPKVPPGLGSFLTVFFVKIKKKNHR